MAATEKMIVIVDSSGTVVGAAHIGASNKSRMNVAMVPLPGQTLHEVDVPQEISTLESGHLFHLAISAARFNAGTRKLEFAAAPPKQ